MLAPQRQAAIVEKVRVDGAVRVSDLVAEFNVSDMTIRRDLEILAERKLVAKVHGGATQARSGVDEEPGFTIKSVRRKEAKHAIARAAAGFVQPGESIALSAGTTTWVLARHLTGVADVTVVTNSIRVAEVFHQHDRDDQKVILTGGTRTPSEALVGPIADNCLDSLNVDTLFLGVHGISTKRGFTTPNIEESETNKALIRAARRVIVVADSTKWQTVGTRAIAPVARADVLVTDADLPEPAKRTLRDHVGRLVIADT